MGPCYNAGIDRYDSSMVLMEREEFKRRLDDLLEIISDGLAYFTAWQELNSDWHAPKKDSSVSVRLESEKWG